ncbi:hypothetical protein [Labilibacter marinus]|uniref:hypothetical protein n=1 Tax=Labilibacter marinus TaxID=1477105 RepID=UPI0008355297|nr:hypothetical protein [Labilibacter marinus]
MKLLRLTSTLLITISLFSCSSDLESKEDDPQPDKKTTLRLKKMSTHPYFELSENESTTIFEYNANGLLTKRTDNYGSDNIEYNDNNNPTKITNISNYDPANNYTETIEWVSNGFNTQRTYSEESYESNERDRFVFDDKNMLTSFYLGTDEKTSTFNYLTDDFTHISKSVKYDYEDYSTVYDITIEWSAVYHPFKGINPSLKFYLYWDIEHETKIGAFSDYLIAKYSKASSSPDDEREIIITPTIINDNNYPTQIEIKNGVNDTSPEYFYFDYEEVEL